MQIIEAILFGFFTGLGVETAKIIHELYIADYVRKTKELKLNSVLQNGINKQ